MTKTEAKINERLDEDSSKNIAKSARKNIAEHPLPMAATCAEFKSGHAASWSYVLCLHNFVKINVLRWMETSNTLRRWRCSLQMLTVGTFSWEL